MSGTDRVESVQLTGAPRVISGPDGVPFVPDKRYQLLAYLAYNGEWVGRERVAALFWPDTDTGTSKQNLRGLLQRLKSVPWAKDISVTPHQLMWAPPTDVARYRAALREGRVDQALAAYSGLLLAGLESDDDGEFSEWLQIEREKLRGDWRGVALARIRSSSIGEARSATELYRRLLDDDPLDENAVCVYIGAMRRAGRIDEARAAYRTFASRLLEEMGLEPTAKTQRALEELDEATVSVGERFGERVDELIEERVGAFVEATSTGRLPTVPTTFVGRVLELRDLIGRLRDPVCRLLSVVGPGGVGKTRLAVQAVRELQADFDAVVFVALESLSSPDEVPAAIAGALGIRLATGGVPLQQVTRALQDSRTLLLLDNFEPVLEAAPVINSLLGAGTDLKVLVTSRARLGIEAEWLFSLDGLDYPRDSAPAQFAIEFPAVRLFVERALRVRPSFAPTERQVEQIVTLCTRLDGLPLAIELAAAWVRAMPLDEIIDGLTQNLDLLGTTDRDANPRHRSIRATFEQSWSLLSEAEQSALRRLSVFRGPVASDAAAFVAEAPRVVLAALVDKSLLRLGDDGRYDRHPLLLAFAVEKLAERRTESESAGRRHAAYYRRFLRERTDRARGPQPAKTLDEIEAALPEILTAARVAKQSGDGHLLIEFMRLLAVDTGYLNARGYVADALDLLEAAADEATRTEGLGDAHDLMGRLADALGVHRREFARAYDIYLEAADLARRGGNKGRQAVLLSMSGVMKARQSDPEASEVIEEALALAEAAEDGLSLATVLEHRAFVAGSAGEYEMARELYRRSLVTTQNLVESQAAEPFELNRRKFFALLNLGEIWVKLGRFDEALATRKEALQIAADGGNAIWMGHANFELGLTYRMGGDDRRARDLLVKARSFYKENHYLSSVDRVDAVMAELGNE